MFIRAQQDISKERQLLLFISFRKLYKFYTLHISSHLYFTFILQMDLEDKNKYQEIIASLRRQMRDEVGEFNVLNLLTMIDLNEASMKKRDR